MLLNHVGSFNDISPKTREALEKKVKGFGKQVLYKFDLERENPDPEKRDGKFIYPHVYTLDPRRFTIIDENEERKDKQKTKNIAIIKQLNDKGEPEILGKIQIRARDKGVLRLDLENEDDFATSMFLELHPKHKGGQFSDKNKHNVFWRVNEAAAATEKRKERSEKLEALKKAQAMSDKEVIQFADAMTWDSTQEPVIIRSQIEDMAENEPTFFNEMLAEGNRIIEVKANIKRAMDKGVIAFDPSDYAYKYTGSNQVIAVLQPIGEKTEFEKIVDWIIGSGPQGEQAYNRICNLLK